MKLVSVKSPQHRDGRLHLVNHDLTKVLSVEEIAPHLQALLDNWDRLAPQLEQRYQALNQGLLDDQTQPYRLENIAAPLPRAYQWADCSAYLNHVALVRKARGVEMPTSFLTDPLIYQGGSDAFLGPMDPILFDKDEDYGIDFEAEIAVITDDVPMGTPPEKMEAHIKLFVLVNDVSLRHLVPNELAKGFGFFQAKPSSSFGPVAVTKEELAQDWDGQRVHLKLVSTYNGQVFGTPNTGLDMHFSYPELLAHAAKTRPLRAGTVLGGGTVSNRGGEQGYSCIAEKRTRELLDTGEIKTPFMHFGDRIQIEAFDSQNQPVFGSIDQCVRPL